MNTERMARLVRFAQACDEFPGGFHTIGWNVDDCDAEAIEEIAVAWEAIQPSDLLDVFPASRLALAEAVVAAARRLFALNYLCMGPVCTELAESLLAYDRAAQERG